MSRATWKPAALVTGLVLGLESRQAAPRPLEPVGAQGVIGEVQLMAPSAEQSDALGAFSEQLFNELEPAAVNPVISPLSVFFALGLAQQGAGGVTASELEQVLGLNKDEACSIAVYLLDEYAAIGGDTTLTVANSAWLDDSLNVPQAYVDLVSVCYSAEVFNVDLQSPGMTEQVNGWVSDKTNKLIPQIVESVEDFHAVLANAIYLKAQWETAFETSNTVEGEFTTPDGETVTAHYMSAPPSPQAYFNLDGAAGVVLPYRDGRLGFMAVMSTDGDGLPELTGDSIRRWLEAAEMTEQVQVTMPKFTTQYGLDLEDSLSALGLESAFAGGADLSGLGMADTDPWTVVHKVSMSVGEEGTEAAAATVVMADTSGLLQEPIHLRFDQPYRYAVVDLDTGIPLFLGVMNDTSQAPPSVI